MGLASSKQNADGSWRPSKIALSDPKAVSCTTPFKVDESCAGMYKGDKKILVLGSEGHLLECRNGKNFDTGHNPTEVWVPLAHLAHAGFVFEFATPTGKQFPVEEFARVGIKPCGLEEVVNTVEQANKTGTDNPIKISEALPNLLAGKYCMVFIPGGHLSLNIKRDDRETTGKILDWAHANSLPTATLCHGPDALRCASPMTYKGYKVSAFLDKPDDTAAKFGYLPGKLKEIDYPQRNIIKEQGVIYTNKKNNDSTTTDRELVTGSTNLAAQNFGAACVQKMKHHLANTPEEKTEEAVGAGMENLTIAPTKLSCKCKKVCFEVSGSAPIVAAYVHSKDVQAFFGTDFASLAGIHEEDLTITQGKDNLDSEDRGEKGTRFTCKDCKGYVYNSYTIGVLSVQSEGLGPAFQPNMHIEYAERKADVTDNLVKHDGPPPLNF